MSQLPLPIDPPTRVLMGPGPSLVYPSVLQACGMKTVGHLDPYYLKVMDEMQSMLREVFRTKNEMTMAISGTGSAGMETVVVNLVEPGDKVLVGVNGVFGGRLADVATRAGGDVVTIQRPWGEVFSTDEVKAAVAAHRPKVVCIVMAETSTGASQPIEEISQVVHEAGALLLVDAVTALGGMSVEVDAWEIDAIYSGTQKCLSCPPGLAPVSFSSRAVDAIQARKSKVQSWYLDTNMLANYWGEKRAYHHTAPINMTYALHESLRLLLGEGLASAFARHQLNHRALKAGLAALGITYTAAEGHQLPMLNAVRIPVGVDDKKVRTGLLEEYGIEIGGGLGDFAGKVWRIGLMGYTANEQNVLLLLDALEKLLSAESSQIVADAALVAAKEVYTSAG